jgi:hypothetical protein
MQLGGRAFDRVGARPPAIVGLTLVGSAMWLLSGLSGATTGEDFRLPLVLLGAGMGTMMMALNTHVLNAAPRELVGRVTSLTQALQNVVASLAIATFATILQARLPLHLAEASDAGAPGPALLADAAAFAFGDVYRAALTLIVLAWGLAWTLRREGPAIPSHASAPRREPALAVD